MYYAGTIGQGYVGIADNVECFLFLLLADCYCAVKQRLVLFVLQVFALIALQDCILTFQDRITKCFCQVIGVITVLYLNIGLVRVYAECYVGRQGPRGGGPCQDVSIFAFYFESRDSGTLFNIFLALSYLVGGKRGAAARAVRNDLEALVQESLLPDLL